MLNTYTRAKLKGRVYGKNKHLEKTVFPLFLREKHLNIFFGIFGITFYMFESKVYALVADINNKKYRNIYVISFSQ